jgi:ribosomal protein S18 acetylase RimI-like enzyme
MRTLVIGEGAGIGPAIHFVERNRATLSRPLVLLGSDTPFPFRPRPSVIVVPGIPTGVIACMPLLEEWGIASRLASALGLPGCFDGPVSALADTWLLSLGAAERAEVEIFTYGTPQFRFDATGVDWRALERLFKEAGLGGREGDKIRKAFQNSTTVCFVWDGDRLIGCARALSDLEYHATIYDVAIHPEYQRRGIGSQLIREMLSRLPVWRVLLVADADAARFYERLGFKPYSDVLALLDPTKL